MIRKLLYSLSQQNSPVGDFCDELLFVKDFPFDDKEKAIAYLEQMKIQYNSIRETIYELIAEIK